jgi:two-component system sensor kinase FixL
VGSAGTLTPANLNVRAERKSPAARAVLLGSWFLLVSILLTSVCIYIEGTNALHKLSRSHDPALSTTARTATDPAIPVLMREVETWVSQVSTATAVGVTAVPVAMLLLFMYLRQSRVRLVHKHKVEMHEIYQQLEKPTNELISLKRERKRLEGELTKTSKELDVRVEERTTELSIAYSELEKELKDRRQAERVMAEQAKELERSKDVLELHVQARTQELRKLQYRYESILNSAGEGIYGLDMQGRTTFVNPAAAKITGWKVEELIGKSEREIFQNLPANSSKTNLENPNNEGDSILFYRKDGTNFPAEYVRTSINEKDREVGAVVIFKDITERTRAEEAINRKAAELARSNAELEQFAYVASHDLQEPLRKIQAFGDRLKTKCDAVDLQEGRDYLERMQNAAARMQTLINDLLTFSRVISASQPFVTVDLNAVTKGVLSDLEVRIEQTKAKMEVSDLPTIEADSMQMRQLLQNLIGNALKFQPPDQQPEIKIHGRVIKNPLGGNAEDDPYAEQCELTIEDNGIGFDEKYLDKIFAVFQRLHGRNDYAGTGVGLAVCRRITDRHGGTIAAKSEPGKGAAFTISLPVRHSKKEVVP